MLIYFGIDCDPCTPRPNVYAEKVFEQLGVDYIEPYSKLFGAWEWEVDIEVDFDYEKFDIWMKEYMDNKYEKGFIRGARWGKRRE